MVRQGLSALVLAAMLALTGCGGGGSGTTSYDLNAFESMNVQGSHTYTLSGDLDRVHYGLHIQANPASSPPSAPVAACAGSDGVMEVNSRLFANGTLAVYGDYYRYYRLNPYKVLCDYSTLNGNIAIYADQKSLPSSATVGDSGSLDTAATYYSASLAGVVNRGTDTWALESGSGGNADMCLDGVTNPVDGSGETTELDCYTIDPSGNTSALVITDTGGGQTLILK